MRRLLVLFLTVGLSWAGDLKKSKVVKSLNDGESFVMESPNYPKDSDAWVESTWVIETTQGKHLKMDCDDIRLYHAEPCGDYAVTFTDGTDKKEFCGVSFDHKMKTTSNKLTVVFRTGQWDRGFLHCKVTVDGASQGSGGSQASGGNQPSRGSAEANSHLELISREIDSSEYGGPPGPKDPTCACGWTNKGNQRIIGGKETKINEYPFIVKLVLNGGHCGGTIISSRHILTAAHCTPGATPDTVTVTAGEHDTNSNSETPHTKVYRVARIIDHEDYNPSNSFKHDISILELKEDIEFNQYVGRACMPRGHLPIENKYVKAIGWGRPTNEQKWVSNVLRDVFMRVLTPELCSKAWYGRISSDPQTQYCTWGRGKSACSGDSGGPIVWLDPETNRYTLASIVSFGRGDHIGDCGNEVPRVSTKVSAYLDWINDKINGHQTCGRP